MGDTVIAFVFPEPDNVERYGEIIDRAKKVANDIPDVRVSMAISDAAETIKFFLANGELPVDQDIPTPEENKDKNPEPPDGSLGIQTFKKKPVEIKAVQLRWTTWNDVCDFLGGTIGPDNAGYFIGPEEVSDTCGEVGPSYIALKVTTTHGEEAIVRHGDWIIPDSKPGTFYPCKPDVFQATYQTVVS